MVLSLVATGKEKKGNKNIKGALGLWPGGLAGVDQAQTKKKGKQWSVWFIIWFISGPKVLWAHVGCSGYRVGVQKY